MQFLSRRVPAVVWSGVLAFVLTVGAGGVWTVLLISNLTTSPAIPWAVVVMALLLWLMWRYLGGTWGPKSTSEARRRYLRARLLPGIIVHSLGLLIFFTLVWPYDAHRQLILETGANIGFWLTVAQAIVFSLLAILAFSQLVRVATRARDLASNPLHPISADEPVG